MGTGQMDGIKETGKKTAAGPEDGNEGNGRTNNAKSSQTHGEASRPQTAQAGDREGQAGQKPDRTLLELSIGIIVWGALCQLAGVWFVADKTGYSLGLWMGTLLAVAAGVHMWWSLDRALDFAQDMAVKLMMKHNIIRYVAIVAVMAGIMVSGFANPLAAFLGLMGLKVAAYLQPFTHKVLGYVNN